MYIARTRTNGTRLLKFFGQQSSGEPGSIFMSKDPCCPEYCECVTNYGCRCEHDCVCPDVALGGGEPAELVLSQGHLEKLVGVGKHLPGQHDQKDHGGPASFDFAAAEQSLSTDDKYARMSYANDMLNAEAINSYLRTGELRPQGDIRSDARVKRVVADLDQAVANHTLTDDVVAYRAVDEPFGRGATYTDQAFISVTTNSKLAESWATRDTVITLLIPKGTNFLPNQVESELILPRGSEFEVTGSKRISNLLNKQHGPMAVEKQGPPHPGLIPQTGDWKHPGRWVRPQRQHPAFGPVHTPALGAEARAQADDMYDALLQEADLSPDEQAAINNYSTIMHAEMNEALREGDPLSKDMREVSRVLDAAMRKNALPEAVLVFRGMPQDHWPELTDAEDGEVITDPGYFSTSVSRAAAFKFGKTVEVLLPPGTNYVPGDYKNLEVLLPRNSKFEVRKMGNVVRLAHQPKRVKVGKDSGGAITDWPGHVSEVPNAAPMTDEELYGLKEDDTLLGDDAWKEGGISKQGGAEWARAQGLVPQSGNWDAPGRCIRPDTGEEREPEAQTASRKPAARMLTYSRQEVESMSAADIAQEARILLDLMSMDPGRKWFQNILYEKGELAQNGAAFIILEFSTLVDELTDLATELAEVDPETSALATTRFLVEDNKIQAFARVVYHTDRLDIVSVVVHPDNFLQSQSKHGTRVMMELLREFAESDATTAAALPLNDHVGKYYQKIGFKKTPMTGDLLVIDKPTAIAAHDRLARFFGMPKIDKAQDRWVEGLLELETSVGVLAGNSKIQVIKQGGAEWARAQGLVPKSGDWERPDRWVKPKDARPSQPAGQSISPEAELGTLRGIAGKHGPQALQYYLIDHAGLEFKEANALTEELFDWIEESEMPDFGAGHWKRAMPYLTAVSQAWLRESFGPTIKAYRGQSSAEPREGTGRLRSWSLSRGVAESFARDLGQPDGGILLEAEFPVEEIWLSIPALEDPTTLGLSEFGEDELLINKDTLLTKDGGVDWARARGLVPQSGDWESPGRWIRPVMPAAPEDAAAIAMAMDSFEWGEHVKGLGPLEAFGAAQEIAAALDAGDLSTGQLDGLVNKMDFALKWWRSGSRGALARELETRGALWIKGAYDSLVEERDSVPPLRTVGRFRGRLLAEKIRHLGDLAGMVKDKMRAAALGDPARIGQLAERARERGFFPSLEEAERLEGATFNTLGYSPLGASQKQRSDVKARLVNGIADRFMELVLADPELAMQIGLSIEQGPAGWRLDPRITENRHRADLREYISGLVGHWAESSADHHPISIAMQHAAAVEFGIQDKATMDHIRQSAEKEYESAIKDHFDRHGKAYRAFHRVQYDITQEWLKKNNVTHLTLFRGAALPADVVADAIANQSVYSEAVTDYATQPVSSFSYDLLTAINFSGFRPAHSGVRPTVSVVRVPAERVLSTSLTGYGCLVEGEVTVLGGSDSGLLFDLDVVAENDVEGSYDIRGVLEEVTRNLEEALKDAD